MAQELVTEPAALGRAFDQTRDVGEDELVIVEPHDTEVRLERRERVVGDLGLGRADAPRSTSTCPRSGNPTSAASASSFSSRRSHRSSPYSPCSAKLGARRAFDRNRALPRPPCPPRAREPAVAVARRGRRAARRRAPVHDRAFGHVDDEIVAAHAVLLLARAVGSRRRLAVRMVAEREQRRDVAVRAQPHVAALAAVAAVGSALRHVRLAPERDATGAAVAALHVALRRRRRTRTSEQDTDRPGSAR